MTTDTTAVLGYAWPLVVSPGEAVAFHLSSATLRHAEAALVRVRCGDPDPDGPGLRLEALDGAVDGTVALRHQPIHPGSCAVVPDAPVLAALSSFAVGCYLWPTRPGPEGGAQTVIARWCEEAQAGWRLGLDAEGRLEFVAAVGARVWHVATPRPLLEREWVFVGGVLDAEAGRLSAFQASLDRQAGRERTASAGADGPLAPTWPEGVPLTIAAHALDRAARRTGGHLDGKVDRPRLYAEPLLPSALRGLAEALTLDGGDPRLVAAWDFAQGMATDGVRDRSANRLDGTLRQMPTRAVTGANWDGSTDRWTEAPWQYGAIHFHADDVADAGWSPDLRATLPAAARSGFHALRLRAPRGPSGDPVESFVPFFVRAPPGRPAAPVAFVASTATFLAYANSALRLDQVHAESMLEGLPILSRDDVYLQEHRELGLSTYDTHADGSGWCHSTAARPILNMRPRGNTFNYGNDTHVLDWLEAAGQPYDVVTDEDIHRHGLRALRPYRCVITGSHPEYFSKEMLDAFDAYQRGGGRHMYLGGNGFYWRIGWHPATPHAVEIRRGTSGTRTWEGEAGEGALQSTGEPSGLWRTNGRPPQRLVGVGFSAQVFTRSAPYRWLEAARDPRVAWLTEGVDLEAPLGDIGLRGGGAAGLEVDRVDATLGSSPALLRLATADRLGYGGLPTPEDFRTTHRGLTGDQNARVRADLVFVPTANGGAVFATGSIAWACALSPGGYDNGVSRVTGNVLRRFLDPAPFEGFDR